jgi:putative inorganic carbon (HCO3(-)) transporter
VLSVALFALALGVGVLAGVDPRIGLAAAMGVAFITVVMADLSVGLCLYALLAFLNIVPGGGAFLSFDKVAGALLALSWMAAVASRRDARRAFFSAHPHFSAVMMLFLVWVLLSLTWAAMPGVGVEPASRYILNAFLFLIVFTAVRTRQHVIWLVGAFVTASTLAAVYGLVVPAPTGSDGRLGGSLGEPNELAAVLVAGIVLAAGLAAVMKGKPLARIALVGAAGMCLISIFLTLSRGGLIALAVAMVVAVFVAGRWRPAAALLAVATLSSVVLFFAFAATPNQRARVTEVGSGSGRSDIWEVGWRMVEANPVHGVGVGQFQSSAVHYLIAPGVIKRSDLIVDTPKVAHNIYLQVLAEMGVLGLIPFLIIIGFSLRCSLRAARAFERRRDQGMELMSRSVLVALVGILAADFFVSQQFSKQLWLLLGLGPALLAISSRATEAEGEQPGTIAPLAPQRLEPAAGMAAVGA